MPAWVERQAGDKDMAFAGYFAPLPMFPEARQVQDPLPGGASSRAADNDAMDRALPNKQMTRQKV